MALDAMLNFPDDISDDMFESIKALRAALANEFNPDWDAMAVMVEEQQRMAKRIEELESALAQPEQEPVAWMHTTATGNVYFRKKPQDKVFNPQPVYTAPSQREWQGLTDEERQECLYSDPIFGMAASTFARAVEAKLREKNFDRPS